MDIAIGTAQAMPAEKRLNLFERYLTVWVGLCMIAGVVLGTWAPGAIHTLRDLELVRGSQINLPIALLIWLMIIPMMMKVDFSSIRHVGRRPAGLVVTLLVNWLVKPFSMALILSSSLRPGLVRRKRISILPGRSFLLPRRVRPWSLSGVT